MVQCGKVVKALITTLNVLHNPLTTEVIENRLRFRTPRTMVTFRAIEIQDICYLLTFALTVIPGYYYMVNIQAFFQIDIARNRYSPVTIHLFQTQAYNNKNTFK